MPAPYSQDLRERVVQAYHQGDTTLADVAQRFQVDLSSVKRWLRLERESGSTAPKPMGGAHRAFIVDAQGEAFLRETLADIPDSTQQELCDAYEEVWGVPLQQPTLSRTLQRLKITKKKAASAPKRLNARMSSPPETPTASNKPTST